MLAGEKTIDKAAFESLISRVPTILDLVRCAVKVDLVSIGDSEANCPSQGVGHGDSQPNRYQSS